jgi:hypothetical protein
MIDDILVIEGSKYLLTDQPEFVLGVDTISC